MPEGRCLDYNRHHSLWETICMAYPTIPHHDRPVLILGLIVCVLPGAMAPLFSFLLSRLLYEVSTGVNNTELVNHSGLVVLGGMGLDGLFLGLKSSRRVIMTRAEGAGCARQRPCLGQICLIYRLSLFLLCEENRI